MEHSSVSGSKTRGGPLPAQSPTRTSARKPSSSTTATAPRPLRRSGSSNTNNNAATLHSRNNNGQETDGHRYSSHYFPGEESIVLQYPNQWHDEDDDDDESAQQLSSAIDPFPRFPPPPNYPPPHKAAAIAAAAANSGVTATHHRSALCRTIESATTTGVSGREGVDRVGGIGRGSGSDATKIARNGGVANKSVSVTLNRKPVPEHPDAIDTTSGRIMDATNVINSKTLGGSKVSSSGRRYAHNTLGGKGFTQRGQRHSSDVNNDEVDGDAEEDDDEDDDDGPFHGADGNGKGAATAALAGERLCRMQRREGHRKSEDGGAGWTGSNKLFSANTNGRGVIRDASLVECRTSNGGNTQNRQRRENGSSTAKRSGKSGGDKPNGMQSNHNGNCHTNGHGATCSNLDPQWQRGNIAVTMERYEPSTSSSSMSSFTSSNNAAITPTCHQEYAYAYYEPGVPMRHSNMQSPVAGPSTAPPPNSIRALLAKGSRNNSFGSPSSSGSSRHAVQSRFGTQENIYEEIGSDGRVRLVSSQQQQHHHHHQSMFSLDPASVEEEFRRVQNRHERTLEELNLSVEAMLMPSHEDTAPVIRQPTATNGGVGLDGVEDSDFHLRSLGVVVDDEVASGSASGLMGGDNESAVGSSSHTNGDLDSGFSGSSSGTSYVGSLRYQRAGSAMSNCCPSTLTMRSPNPNELHCRYNTNGNGFPNRMSGTYASSRSHNFHTNAAFSESFVGGGRTAVLPFGRSAEDPGPSRAHIVNLHANHMYSNCVAENGAQMGPGDVKTGGGRLASFWSRKGWRLPGFSTSTTSVNKAGVITAGSVTGGGGGGAVAATNALCFGRHPSP